MEPTCNPSGLLLAIELLLRILIRGRKAPDVNILGAPSSTLEKNPQTFDPVSI